VVFVADSQRHCLGANLESVRDMEQNLSELGYDLRTTPLVLQCNKRDLPDITPVSLMRQRLGFDGAPCFASVATEGAAVFDTLKAIINLVVKQVQRQI
jgi:signal recognition particle receptor subunit beta